MTLLSFSITVDDRNADESAPRRSRAHLHVSLVVVIATAVVAIGLLSGQGNSARGDDKDPSKPGSSVLAQGSYQAFVSEIRQVLKRNDDRLIGLVNAILQNAEPPDLSPDEIPGHELQVSSAEARYKKAKLDREAAKLAVDEYQNGTFVREKSIAESEIQCARNELERARKALPEAKERLVRIRALLRNESALSLDVEYRYIDRVAAAELLEVKARFGLEQAESKKKVLEQYTKRKTITELMSEVEKAMSDELATQATWELEKGKLVAAKRMTKRPELTDVEKRILSLVQQAFPIQEAIEAKRDQLIKGRELDESLESALRDLTNQIESLVDQAAIEHAAARIAILKREIRVGARRSTSRRGSVGFLAGILNRSSKPALGEETPRSELEIPAPEKPSLPRAAIEAQPSLTGISDRLIDLAERVLKDPRLARISGISSSISRSRPNPPSPLTRMPS